MSREVLTNPGTDRVWAVADTEQSVPERFVEQVRRQPAKPAIAGTAWQPTFEELDAAAAAIARVLTERGGSDPGRVALLMDHDALLIAAMLGVMKAGHALVVLNPIDPPGRLDRIRRQVEPGLALIDPRHRILARQAGFAEVVEVPAPSPAADEPAAAQTDPRELAAVLYTSGSTGGPKGVMHTHHTLLHTALRHAGGLGLRPDDRVALLASPSGGHGMGTTWMTLLTGATLCPFAVMDRGVAGLPRWLREHRITVLGMSASLFRRLVPSLDGDAFPDLRLVRLGSEQVRRADFDACRRHLGEECGFANVFSLTEAGGLAHCLFGTGQDPRPGPLPVGRQAEGVEILLLDERGEPVQAGETGEIFIRSRHLSPGYWRDEELTAERFSKPARSGERFFRTGDLGHLDADGRLVIVGRGDAQVKIRGYRVELPEVEAALSALPGVEAAAARAEPTRHGDPKLTAYVVTRGGVTPPPAELREGLRATLSDASLPTAFAFVGELPLNSHGKVDRELLARLSLPTWAAGAGVAAPASELERRLSQIWAEALELERVGSDDDFYDLGGDSLSAAEIGAGVHEAFGVELDMRAFAGHPTVAGMADLIARRRGRRQAEPPRLERAARDRPLPCSFAQERIWRNMRTAESPTSYTMASVTGLHGPIRVDALRQALEHVAARHEPLRTTFAERNGELLQIVHPAAPLEVPLTDLSGARDPDTSALQLQRKVAAAPFDLEHGPLVRFHLVRLSDDDHRLVRVSHHLNSDRRSWWIFFTELSAAYEALRGGQPAPTPERRLQYADYAVWERGHLRCDASRYREQVAWWRHALAPTPPPLQLPFARQEPASGLEPRDGSFSWGIDPAVAMTLDRLGRGEGATHYAVRLALFSALVGLEGGMDEITIGAYVDTRRLPETRSMFGYFSNLITLILPFDPAAPFRGWLGKVRSILAEATARSDLPYERLCEELLASGQVPPEVNAIFGVRFPMPELPFGKAEEFFRGVALVTMPWGFSFTVDQGQESEGCEVAFDAHLYDPSAVRQFVDRYAGLAEAAGAHPERPLRDLHAALG